MEDLIGAVLLALLVWGAWVLIRGGRDPQGPDERPRQERPAERPAPPPTTRTDDERRRQDRADDAFIDGVIFAHHFDPLDRFDDERPAEASQDDGNWADDAVADDAVDDDAWDDDLWD